jgi:hypothetical protein
MNNQFFVELNNNEQEEVNGGLIGLIIGGIVLVAGTIVGNEALERNTEHDLAGWIGYGLDKAGEALSTAGDWLMN